MNKWKEMEVTKPKDTKKVDDWYKEMKRQFEEDSKEQDFSLSQEWDEDFKKAMFGEDKKGCKKRTYRKLTYVAAGIALLAIAGVGMAQNEVIADSLEEIFNSKSNSVDSEFDHFGTKEEMSAAENECDEMFSYEDKTLTEVYAQIKDELKRPFFQIKNTLDEYKIEDAFYGAEYDMIIIQLATTEGRIFISQREIVENTVISTKVDENSMVIWNENLKQDIVINKSVQDDSYTFSVKEGYVVFNFNGYISEKICVEIAENLSFE